MIAKMTDASKKKEATMHLDMSKAEMKKGDMAACMKHMNEAHKAMDVIVHPGVLKSTCATQRSTGDGDVVDWAARDHEGCRRVAASLRSASGIDNKLWVAGSNPARGANFSNAFQVLRAAGEMAGATQGATERSRAAAPPRRPPLERRLDLGARRAASSSALCTTGNTRSIFQWRHGTSSNAGGTVAPAPAALTREGRMGTILVIMSVPFFGGHGNR